MAAVEEGAQEILVGAGGSATTDGGAGALEAIEDAGGLGRTRLTVLCDVRTPFELAAAVFAPQKGADPVAVKRLARRLDRFAKKLPRDPRDKPLTGAAGGLSGGLWAAHGAKLVSGASFVLDALDFDARMKSARAVVTGEGRLDIQSLEGKLVGEVATRARQSGVPCVAVVGENALDAFGARILDFDEVLEAGAKRKLTTTGRRLARMFSAG
jgi:glycerate kinase